MHGWALFGSHHTPRGQRIFWFSILSIFLALAGFLIKENISAYDASVTTIKTVDRTADLNDVFFPSVVICNINQLRKSFIYWLHDNLNDKFNNKSTISVEDVFSLVNHHYFRVENEKNEESEKHEDLLELILGSKFYEKKFEEFYQRNLDALKYLAPPDNKLYYYNYVYPAELFGVLSNCLSVCHRHCRRRNRPVANRQF